MFCPKCGQKLIPQTRFCAHCGADAQSLLQQLDDPPPAPQGCEPEIHEPKDDAPTPEAAAQEIAGATPPKAEPEAQQAPAAGTGSPQSTSDDDPLATAVGKNQAYYLPEFQRIRSGEKPRFNRAAFFFGPAFCLYRKCEDLFKRYFLIPVSLIVIGYLVQTIGMVQFDLTLMIGGGIAAGIGGILGFVDLIRLGLDFDRLYYERFDL